MANLTGLEIESFLKAFVKQHVAHQLIEVSKGKKIAVSPRRCRQCRDAYIEGIYTVMNYDNMVHFEALCEHCAIFEAPRRCFMGAPCVKAVSKAMSVIRHARDDWEIVGVAD